MACPRFEVVGKSVVLISGFRHVPATDRPNVRELQIQAIENLRQAASENPDTKVFGYTAGRWVPAD
jgi:hypothetical protein